jgi:hypothetical protein
MNARRAAALVVCLATAAGILSAQPRVNQRNMYERVMAIVPVIGAGTAADPKRPLYAPAPHTVSPTSRTGILGFTYVLSDDGHFALVEFVARERSAFSPMLADSSIKAFLKGRDDQAAIVAEFGKLKKNFDINHFGVRLP